MTEGLAPEQWRALDYLRRKGTESPVADLRVQVECAFTAIEAVFDTVPVSDRSRAPNPGSWSAHEILDHLVLSHGPAVAQLQHLLAGTAPGGEAIPAHLHRPATERPAWDPCRQRLSAIHRELLWLLDTGGEGHSLEPKAPVELVVKAGHEIRQWTGFLDWKAYAQAIRVHTIEHHSQLRRALDTIIVW